LDPHQERQHSTRDEKEEGPEQIQDLELRVIDRRDPTAPALARFDREGLAFQRFGNATCFI